MLVSIGLNISTRLISSLTRGLVIIVGCCRIGKTISYLVSFVSEVNFSTSFPCVVYIYLFYVIN